MIACERLQGQGVIVTDCKGAAVVANKLKLGVRKPRGRHSRVEHRIQASIGDIEVQWMRSHQTAQQAEAAGLPAAYLAGNDAADLLVGSAVRDVPDLPPELSLFRRAAAAARSFWSLFASACPTQHRVPQHQTSQSNKLSFSRVASLLAKRAADTSSPSCGTTFYSHLAGVDGSAPVPGQCLPLEEPEAAGMSGVDDTASDLDVRVDDEMDQRVPAIAEDLEVPGPTYRVGPHLCNRTNGDTRMTCKKCGRYVTSYK
eukprot:432329-Amphidinium_carterae.1